MIFGAYQFVKRAKENLVASGKLPPRGTMPHFPNLPEKNS